MSDLPPPVITIDGPSGTGKGTLCALLAKKLGWHLLDSGLIYRLLALEVLQSAIDVNDVPALVHQAHHLNGKFDDAGRVYLAGQEVTYAVREEQCGQIASQISAHGPVREALLARQRGFLALPGLVADGRDMGTVVFPQACVKFFLTASTAVRAQRRFLQLQGTVPFEDVTRELLKRDERDMTRAVSPLQPAEDAIVLDTSSRSIEEVLEDMCRHVPKTFQ